MGEVNPKIEHIQKQMYQLINELFGLTKGCMKLKYSSELLNLTKSLNRTIRTYEYLLSKYGDLLEND